MQPTMRIQSQITKTMTAWLASASIKPTAQKEIDGSSVQVYIVDSVEVADNICVKLRETSGGSLYPLLPLIGFDTETNISRLKGEIAFSFNAPKKIKANDLAAPIEVKHTHSGTLQSIPSMIQIAVSHHLVFIFRCFVMTYNQDKQQFYPHKFPPALAALLKSSHVTKIGVAAVRDSDDILTYFNVKGLGLPKQSLAALTYMYTGTILSKEWKLLSSRWDGRLESLSQDSLWYAANDALYALKIFEGMVKLPEVVPEVFPNFDSGFKGLSHYYKGKKVDAEAQVVAKSVRGPHQAKKIKM